MSGRTTHSEHLADIAPRPAVRARKNDGFALHIVQSAPERANGIERCRRTPVAGVKQGQASEPHKPAQELGVPLIRIETPIGQLIEAPIDSPPGAIRRLQVPFAGHCSQILIIARDTRTVHDSPRATVMITERSL
jgi:hypothetical protein